LKSGKLARHLSGDCPHLGARLLERGGRKQSSNDRDEVLIAVRAKRGVVRGRSPEFVYSAGERVSVLQYADDRSCSAVQVECLSEHRTIVAEQPVPRLEAENDCAWRRGIFVGDRQQSSKERLHAEHLHHAAHTRRAEQLLRVAVAGEHSTNA
jgi:hypothetical protein